MKIIPVLDLKNGLVVHARLGQRDSYQAICTPLCQSAKLEDVIAAFLTLYRFDTFYIADLNAITEQGDHSRIIAKATQQFPDLQFWVDAGYQRVGDYHNYADNYTPVLGSESYDNDKLADLKAFDRRFILSLDYSATNALGNAAVFSDADIWPDKIIIMTLARVGSRRGPDLDKLGKFCRLYRNKTFIAAGGVRNKQDLIDLQAHGIHYALLATALHSGAINAADIADLDTKKCPD
ncbi:MAG: HisA/HisF-related TIM barrel protein [Methylococcales bacterium]